MTAYYQTVNVVCASSIGAVKSVGKNVSDSCFTASPPNGSLTGCVANWPLTYTSLYTDTSGSSYNGVATGTTPIAGVSGIGGRSFNGSSDFINMAVGSALSFPDTTFSISLWIKGTGIADFVIANYVSGGGWGLTGAGSVWLKSAANSQSTFVPSSATSTKLGDGTWHHLVTVITTSTTVAANNNVYWYIDGLLDNTAQAVPTSLYAGSPNGVSIGAREAGAGGWWPGSLDYVQIYPFALTQAQVSTLYGFAGVNKSVGKTISEACATSIVAFKRVGKNVSDVCASSIVAVKGVGKTVSSGAASSVAVLKGYFHTVQAVASSSVSLVKSVGKIVSDSCASSISIVKDISKIVSDSCASAISTVKGISKTISVSSVSSMKYFRQITKTVFAVSKSAIHVVFPVDLDRSFYEGGFSPDIGTPLSPVDLNVVYEESGFAPPKGTPLPPRDLNA